MENSKAVSKNLKNSSLLSRAPKANPSAFIKRVQNVLHKKELLNSVDAILVAVSGGPDSMALLATFLRLYKKSNWSLAVAHVNYHLRDKDSTKDAELVERFALQNNLPFYLLNAKKKDKVSEESLRNIRYDFFESLVKKHGFTKVALAHHQDDQAETVLLRLIRGTGSQGLAGMQAKRGLYIRPFLDMPKSELLSFLAATKTPYRPDASNQEDLYLRNRVRNELLPLLETYNPKIKESLSVLARNIQTEMAQKGKNWPFPVTLSAHTASFSRADWQTLAPQLQTAQLRDLFQEMNLPFPTKAFLETILKDLSNTREKGFTREYSRLRLLVNSDTIHIHFNEID